MVQGARSFLPAEPGSGRQFGKAFGWNKRENHEALIAAAQMNVELAAK
jgi:hypothetical protein